MIPRTMPAPTKECAEEKSERGLFKFPITRHYRPLGAVLSVGYDICLRSADL
jgi:hypothetical protein